ncbi:hypothetical protein ABPG75_003691 [Micractinium tetrahymenae]
MQAFVGYCHLTVALHCIFLDDEAQPRAALSEQEQHKALLLLLRSALVNLNNPCSFKVLDPLVYRPLVDTEQGLACALDAGQVPLPEREVVRFLYRLCRAAVVVMFQRGLAELALSAGELRTLFLLAQQAAARRLADLSLPRGETGDMRAAAAASAALVQLRPGDPACLLRHARHLATLGSTSEAAAPYRRTLQVADEAKGRHVLGWLLRGGADGPVWSKRRVRALLVRAEAFYTLCKPWVLDRGAGLRHACQKRAWKEGWHRQECARLASSRAAGGSTTLN